ncbi:MAG: EAL domain-containing protein, partial [Tissierellaceae bacterium]|nr:EAL domain-containing protein [Tissierellaceae bacterium]
MKKMIRNTIFFILIGILFLNSFIVAQDLVQEDKKIYKFAGDLNYPPYEYVDKNGVFTGFNVDIMNAIGEATGLEFELTPMEWKDAVEALDNGEVDGLIGMAQNEERVSKYDFPKPSIVHEQVIFVRSDTVHINGVQDLEGEKVAYQKSDYNESIIVNIPNVMIYPMNNQEETLKALKYKQVDAVLGNKLVGIYLLQKNRMADDIKIVGGPIVATDYGPVVAKGNEELLDILNKGLDEVLKKDNYKTIYNKWVGEDIHSFNFLFEIYKEVIFAVIAMILSIFFFLYMYNKSLQKQVNTRTAELEMANSNLIKHQEEIYNLAYYDSITSLPNRTYFVEELRNAIEEREDNNSKLAILFLDIDKFKHINDTLGHEIGDYILKLLGNRLTKLAKRGNLVARVGGDEYYILINRYETIEDITDLANTIIDDFKEPYYIKEYTLYLTTSIGIATYPDGGMDANNLIKNADLALYKSKDLGGNTYYIYGEEIKSKGLEKMMLLNQLRHAMEYDELVLYYQPQIEISTGKIRGVEALVRWQHPEKGLLYPDEFIPLAEESGIIIPMGEWILKKACMDAKKWEDQGHEIVIAVNISSKQFQYRDFLNEVINAIYVSGINPRYLTLEITESIAISDMEHTLKILKSLRSIGVSVAIDDFGTGYSSLSYLNDMNVNELKIDKSFIWDIEKNEKNKMISNTIILLSKQMGLQVIAEGIENSEQLSILKEMECDIAQGYYFSRPVP